MADKKVMLMSTSKGKGGAQSALQVVNKMLPRFGAEVVTTFSLPSYGENFTVEKGIMDQQLARHHGEAVETFLKAL